MKLNAHIFLGEFEQAAEHYKMTLLLAQELGDRAVEAQACYSLGNTYTLLKDFPTAVEYHLRHLRIAQELFDGVSGGMAAAVLPNIFRTCSCMPCVVPFSAAHTSRSAHARWAISRAAAGVGT